MIRIERTDTTSVIEIVESDKKEIHTFRAKLIAMTVPVNRHQCESPSEVIK